MNIILIVLTYFSTALIQNDYGEYTGFESNACDAGSSQTKTISFSDTFLSVPQVFYNLKKLSLQFTADGDEAQVKSEILSITTIDFQVKVSCPLTTGFSPSYQFYWYATMLQNITVIRSNIISNPKDNDRYTHTHSNSLATKGIVTLTDLQYKTTFGFYLSVQVVTSNQVKIAFYTKGASPPVSIGYFIVIGPSDVFSLSSNTLITSNEYTSRVNVEAYQTLLVTLQGFGWSSGQPQVYTGVTQITSSKMEFSIGTYAPTVTTEIDYQLAWMCRYAIMIYPMYVNKYRITLIEVINVDFPLKIILNGQTYTQVGKYSQNIPTVIQTCSVQVFLKFFQNTILQGTLLKCVNCGSNFNYVVKKNYLNSINMIIFNIEIKQYLGFDIKNLEITMSSTGVLIKSIGTQMSDDKATILNLQFQNIV